MSARTSIAWCDASWNPIVGCTRVSAGCEHCYAERFAHRWRNIEGHALGGLTRPGGGWNGTVRLNETALDLPLRWRKPKRIFVNSMSDLFHEALTDEQIDRVFGVMAKAFWHDFQVLTKRPERMREYLARVAGGRYVWKAAQAFPWPSWAMNEINRNGLAGATWPLPNVLIGVSVEDQATADERIPLLLQTPAAKRFISAEPLLGPVDFTRWLGYDPVYEAGTGRSGLRSGGARRYRDRRAGPDLARGEARLGSLATSDDRAPVQEGSGRERHGCLFDDSSDDRRDSGLHGSPSTRVPPLQRPDSSGSDGEPRERGQEGQPAGESHAGELFGSGPPRATSSPSRQDGSERRAERDGETSRWDGAGDTSPPSGGREPALDRDGVRDLRQDSLEDRAPRTLGLDLVIVGGESGPNARPCDVAWIRSVVEQCKAAGVACFVKQLGARPYSLAGDSLCADGEPPVGTFLALRQRAGSDPSEWPDDIRVQEWPR